MMHSNQITILRRAHGFSLTELMVSIGIGLLILAGMATLFSNNARTQSEVEKANLQIENGRFTIQTLNADLINAGYYAEFDPTLMTTPAAMPNPCSVNLPLIRASLPLHIQGVDNVTSTSTPSCMGTLGVKAGTDILVIRRTQTCEVGTGNCAPTGAGGAFFQASLCSNATQLDSPNLDDSYDLDTDTTLLTRRKRNCTSAPDTGTLAAVRRFVTHIYFISDNSSGSDGIPTLKRLELGGTTLGFSVVPLVEGVENLQFEHGIDFDNNGTPDVYAADPALATDSVTTVTCTGPTAACAPANWRNVVAVRMHVLARNMTPSTTVPPNKTYVMGRNADNSANEFTPASSDMYRRHLFQSMTHLSNPAGRKTP